jgi:hypothetical protein
MEKLKRIYEKAEKAVCEIADIELDKFLTSHEEKYVDARSILVDWLIRAGFTEKMIEKYSDMPYAEYKKMKSEQSKKGTKK